MSEIQAPYVSPYLVEAERLASTRGEAEMLRAGSLAAASRQVTLAMTMLRCCTPDNIEALRKAHVVLATAQRHLVRVLNTEGAK